MRFLYNTLFLFFFALSAPFYFFKMWRRGNWRAGFAQRFGSYDGKIKQALTNRHAIWFHAVSVGEVNVCAQLIQALEPRVPNLKIVVSTTTSTGMAELQKRLPTHVTKIYYPIDRRKFVRRALATISPEAIVLVEAEIWPNFLWRAIDRDIPLLLVNTRLSEKSFRGYSRFRFLFAPIFRNFCGVGAQKEADKERLVRLGFRPETVHTFGNLKFDAVKVDGKSALDVSSLLKQIGVNDQALVLVAGSTHSGEERILAEIFLRLKKQFPQLFLVLVPRHTERTRDVVRELKKAGVAFHLRSEILPSTQLKQASVDCLLVNTTGELVQFYKRADVVFVGKSLTAKGGQSPIEPGDLGKAMVFGPHMEKFTPIEKFFLEANGAVQVPDAKALEATVAELLRDKKRREELGRNALAVVNANRGGVAKTVEMIVEQLKSAEVPTHISSK